MAISKAAWRAFDTCAEPRTPSQWVWLGRSTPMWWRVNWSGLLQPPPSGAPAVPFPSNPGPQVSFKDHAYLAQHDAGSWDTLAWDTTQSSGGVTYRTIVQWWTTATNVEVAVSLIVGTFARVWWGKAPVSQRDARLDDIRIPPFGSGTLVGGSLHATPGISFNALGLECVQPAWSTRRGIFDMVGGPPPTSLDLTYIF